MISTSVQQFLLFIKINRKNFRMEYGGVWGLFWIPLRALEEAGINGLWVTFVYFLVPTIFLIPVGICSYSSTSNNSSTLRCRFYKYFDPTLPILLIIVFVFVKITLVKLRLASVIPLLIAFTTSSAFPTPTPT